MAQTGLPSDSAPILCLTPLYHFSSNASELVIDQGIQICHYDELKLKLPTDAVITKHFQFHAPDYLLWHDPLLSHDVFVEDFMEIVKRPGTWDEKGATLAELFLSAAMRLFQVLRLFKPGRLRAGETFILTTTYEDDRIPWKTLASGRASAMMVDFGLLSLRTTSYSLDIEETDFFAAFRKNLLPILKQISSFPAVQLALYLYGSDGEQRLDAVQAFTALEALLTKEEEIEGLTHRLASRIANLTGHDPEMRKQIFVNVKNFYKLRSKIVHGSQLNPKLARQLDDLRPLRDTLRRVLLSVMGLYSAGIYPTEVPDLLDDLTFDEDKRKEVQAKTSQFLHLTDQSNRRS